MLTHLQKACRIRTTLAIWIDDNPSWIRRFAVDSACPSVLKVDGCTVPASSALNKVAQAARSAGPVVWEISGRLAMVCYRKKFTRGVISDMRFRLYAC